MYASAQPLDFLARRKKLRFPNQKQVVSCPEFPDRNYLEVETVALPMRLRDTTRP
jgi:hypothetical protein